MPKLSVSANELINTKITAVDLVKRGAIRVPFRIMKSQDTKEGIPMLDLGKIGTMLMKGEPKPTEPVVSSVLFAKSYTVDKAQDFLKGIGLSSDTLEDTDDALIYKQEGGVKDGDQVIKLDDSVSMTVSNVAKMFQDYEFESEDFNTVLQTESFFPSLRIGTDAMRDTIENIMSRSSSASEAKGLVGKAVSDFGKYVSMLMNGLPEASFKAEALLAKMDAEMGADKDDEKSAPEESADDKGGETPESIEKSEGIPVDKADVSSEKDTSKDIKKGEEPPEGEGSVDVPTMLATFMKSTSEAFTKITDTLSEVTKTVGGLKESVTTQEGRVTDLAGQLEKTDKVLSGTVTGGAPADKQRITMIKNSIPPLLDTALMTESQKKEAFAG